MRINAGTCKGRKLHFPKTHLVRPASDKVKQALFNILGNVEDLSLLDLFAGSGSLALEGLSRGAKDAVLVDLLPESLKIIQKNIELCGFQDRASLVKGKIPVILKKIKALHPQNFDVVFLDPPYDKDLVNPSLTALAQNNLIDAESLVIIEHSPREGITAPGFETLDHRKYGQTLISILKAHPSAG